MATANDRCAICLRAPSIDWDGIPICTACLSAARTAKKENLSLKLGITDSGELLVRYCTYLAMHGKTDPMGLASIGRSPDATLH